MCSASARLLLVLTASLAACRIESEEEKDSVPDAAMVYPERPCPGYTLFSAPSQNASEHQRTILLDMNGSVVHKWPIVGMPVTMLPGGDLLGSKRMRPGAENVDAMELVQVDWDGNERWSFSNWDDDGTGTMMSRQHHDLQREGNPVGYYAPRQDFAPRGNTLVLAHKTKTVPKISDRAIIDDVIYEASWHGRVGFQWHASDHFDEMGFDQEAKQAIRKNPGYMNISKAGDWLHVNSAALLGRNHWYEEDGDQRFHPQNIIFSSRAANFVAIVSRETGKIVWRVGPDFSPGHPEAQLGQFVGQHHAHMIPWGLPGAGNILVFDNGGVSGYGGSKGYPKYVRMHSRVLEFDPVSLQIVWEYGDRDHPNLFMSYFISSAQRLPNGNTLITDGANGMLFEVTPSKLMVWKHISTSVNDLGNNYVYRAYRTPPEWLPAGFNPGDYARWSTAHPPLD
jgi:hypothetical protein